MELRRHSAGVGLGPILVELVDQFRERGADAVRAIAPGEVAGLVDPAVRDVGAVKVGFGVNRPGSSGDFVQATSRIEATVGRCSR
ncbi:hypothetical protein [Rhodococcus jostii]|uniref:hypothetical protein n=1 Tax=Rhodococcus jostii TaxID=132919 RepID=UPI003631BC43